MVGGGEHNRPNVKARPAVSFTCHPGGMCVCLCDGLCVTGQLMLVTCAACRLLLHRSCGHDPREAGRGVRGKEEVLLMNEGRLGGVRQAQHRR